MHPSDISPYLNSFVNFESKLHALRAEDFSLNRIGQFLDLAGNPAANLKIVHVAGTKGKGSTCAFLAEILREAGCKVGLYTSPHLHKVNERIRVLDAVRSEGSFGGSISDDDLCAVLSSLRPFAAAVQNEGNVLTYFEVLTVAALTYFARSQVDIAILETGLGGRLDATNAVESMAAVITPVSMDHTAILGNTLSQIASEKAGIIKSSHQKVVIAPQTDEAMKVIVERCREFGVQPVMVSPEKYQHLKIGLQGRHQIVNAATAVEAAVMLRETGFNISEQAVQEGLKHARWPGRFELLRKNPDVIADGAHNEASARAFSQALADIYPQRRVILILGVSQDKDVAAICRSLKDQAAHIILTQASHPRAHAFTQPECMAYFGAKPFEIIENPAQSIERALQIAGPADVIAVTGSIFMAAEARTYLGAV